MANLHSVGTTPDVTLVTTAEAVCSTSSPFGVANPAGQGNYISGVVAINPTGAGTTSVDIRVRADSLTGTLISEIRHTIGAAAAASIPYACLDPNLSDDSAVYVVTAQQNGATGNGTVTSSTIAVEAATARE